MKTPPLNPENVKKSNYHVVDQLNTTATCWLSASTVQATVSERGLCAVQGRAVYARACDSRSFKRDLDTLMPDFSLPFSPLLGTDTSVGAFVF